MDEIKLSNKTADAIYRRIIDDLIGNENVPSNFFVEIETYLHSLVISNEEIIKRQLENLNKAIGLPVSEEEHKSAREYEAEITKRTIERYIKEGLPVKYNKGAPDGWEKGISYKYEVEILRDCGGWLDKEDEMYAPPEIEREGE